MGILWDISGNIPHNLMPPSYVVLFWCKNSFVTAAYRSNQKLCHKYRNSWAFNDQSKRFFSGLLIASLVYVLSSYISL